MQRRGCNTCSYEAATPQALWRPVCHYPMHLNQGPTPTASFDLLNQGDIMVTCTRLFSAETCCSKSHIPTQQLGFYLPITYLSGTSMGKASGQPSLNAADGMERSKSPSTQQLQRCMGRHPSPQGDTSAQAGDRAVAQALDSNPSISWAI